jgi:glutathione synthase/RimK-type ligase-like ATP-grasp enzyme
MKKICFLSCQSLEGHIIDDTLAIAELEKSDAYQVTSIPWDNEANWADFDLVIIRTTWDYHKRPVEFVEKLKFIAGKAKLLNAPEVVEWNFHKGYLKELEAKGVKIVPTQMFKYPGEILVPADWDYEKFIVKPAISANAYKTMIVARKDLNSPAVLSELYAGDWMLQPFIEEIKQGEVSLHFFNKQFSHGIIKVPKPGDFRVQEEHGGHVTVFLPDADLLKDATDLVTKVPFDLLYARVDVVNWRGHYVLMEIELIEPALYFRTSSQAVKNFKAALDKIFTNP